MTAIGVMAGDMIARALPGARVVGTDVVVEGPLALRHIEGTDYTVELTGPVPVRNIEALSIVFDGHAYLALLIELTETDNTLGPVTALALYADGAGSDLIDVVDVGTDRLVSFGAPPTVTLDPNNQLLLVSNRHGNSNQFYEATTLIDLIDSKLVAVDTIFTLSDRSCAGSRVQSLDFPAASGGSFDVAVTDSVEPPTEDCDNEPAFMPSETRYSARYVEDAVTGRYHIEGDGWAALEEINAARY